LFGSLGGGALGGGALGGGALGGTTSSTIAQPSSALFGQAASSAPATQAAAGTSLFGQSTAKPLGGSLFTGVGQQSTATNTPLAAAG
jgi:hypothetical protein